MVQFAIFQMDVGMDEESEGVFESWTAARFDFSEMENGGGLRGGVGRGLGVYVDAVLEEVGEEGGEGDDHGDDHALPIEDFH